MFNCPLSKQLMVDPVVADDGHTYERAAIERHLKKSQLSPLTKESISRRLVENKLLLQEIGEHVKGTSEAAKWKSARETVQERKAREQTKAAKELYASGSEEDIIAAAEMGYALAQDYLGQMYHSEEQYEVALSWSELAAEQGNVDSIYRMAVLTEKDDPDKAIAWYKKCMTTVVIAPTNLANLYKRQGDNKAAFGCLMYGAKQGYAHNMRDVAESYKTGTGVDVDLVEAGKWYKKAAEKGCLESRYEMGRRHLEGVGGPKCLSEGLRFMELAAKGEAEDDPGSARAKEKAQRYLTELTDLMARL
jgi:TPR repeat protein